MKTEILNNSPLFKQKTRHFQSLNFLKFFLAIIIVFHHFQQILEVKFPHFNFFYGRIYFGYAVEFFFIISGFVQAFQNKNKPMGDFRSWMLGKMCRVLPMAALSIFACIPLYFVRRIFVEIFTDWNSVPGLWNLVTSLTCTFSGGAIKFSSLGINNPLWYVSVLFQCYTVLFILNRISSKIGIQLHYLCGGMILLGLGAHYYEIELPFLNSFSCRGYAAFFLGVLLHDFYSCHNPKKALLFFSAFTAFVSACSIVCNVMSDDEWAIMTFLLFPSLLFIFLYFERFFSFSIFALLGGVSFEIYLWHFPFLILYKTVREFMGTACKISRFEMFAFTAFLVICCIPLFLFAEKRFSTFVKSKILED